VNAPTILHETRTRLRLQPRAGVDIEALAARLGALAGVGAVRPNRRLHCVSVQHDGAPATRAAVLKAAHADTAGAQRRTSRRNESDKPAWKAGLLAAAIPLLPAPWRAGGALGVVATRLLVEHRRLQADAPAALLDAASLAALAVNGQPLVVSASVLLRLLAEGLSGRLVRQADELLEHLLPTPAPQYRVLPDEGGRAQWRPLRRLRAGDRLLLSAGDVVPVDGCMAGGRAVLHPVAQADAARTLAAGAHVGAGERVLEGRFELLAESDAAHSRLERLRSQFAHVIGARDPSGRLAPDLQRLVSLPLTGAALVLGLTGDTARAAAMLQADPQQGLDLALPVAREAALYALARHGLLTSGLETIERLASARTLVLQDTSVLASGRWCVALVETEPDGDASAVRAWLAALAGVSEPALAGSGLPDALVRQWLRHGAVLRLGTHEVHLASPRRLRSVWNLALADAGTMAPPAGAIAAPPSLRRVFGVVANGRVVARVVLVSAWRQHVARQLERLRVLGFERIAVFAEDDAGEAPPEAAPTRWHRHPDVQCLPDDALARADWLADAVHDGTPLVLVHTVLRDLVPPGSLSLTPAQADAGAHGVLLGDPLLGLETARRLASTVHRRLRTQQQVAIGANAALMTAAAVRWLPPIATALFHHGFALLVLLDSLRIEALGSLDVSQTGDHEADPESPSTTPQEPHTAREPRSLIT